MGRDRGEPPRERRPGAAAGRAFGALALVGVLLALLLWLLLPRFHPGVGPLDGSGPSLELPASRFAAVTGGDVERRSGALVIGSLQDGEAVFAIRESFDAADYPMLRLALSGVHPNLETELYWTTADAPRELNYLPLARGDETVTWHRLAGRAGWEGRVVELGVVRNEVGEERRRGRRKAVDEERQPEREEEEEADLEHHPEVEGVAAEDGALFVPLLLKDLADDDA